MMEETISASNLEWTIARLGFLNDRSSTEYRLIEGALPDRGSSISRAAVAHFLLTEVRQTSYINKILGISG
jgi:hypothetical protein